MVKDAGASFFVHFSVTPAHESNCRLHTTPVGLLRDRVIKYVFTYPGVHTQIINNRKACQYVTMYNATEKKREVCDNESENT